jgi:hypothetical protein
MDSPFYPALISFGPFFLLLLLFALTSPRREHQRISGVHFAVAFAASLGVGVAGAAVSYFLL